MTATTRPHCSFLIIAMLPLLALGNPAHAEGPKATQVRVAPVVKEAVLEYHRVTGNLRAVSRAQVAALEEGKVVSVAVAESDLVKKGQLLAKIDDRRLTIQLREVKSELDVARAVRQERIAERAKAAADLARSKNLRASNAISESKLNDDQAALAVATARVEASVQTLARIANRVALTEVRLADTVVVAPFDGRVVEKHLEIGEWISPGDPVVTLISTGAIDAWLDIPERYWQDTDTGTDREPIEIHLLGKRHSIPAGNSRRVPQIDPRSRTFPLIVRLESSSSSWAPGMSVTAQIPTGVRTEQLTVPRDAVLRDATGFYLFKAEPVPKGGYRAALVRVQVLFDLSGRLVITAEQLSPGDSVVVEGNERLAPMRPIDPVQ